MARPYFPEHKQAGLNQAGRALIEPDALSRQKAGLAKRSDRNWSGWIHAYPSMTDEL